MHNEGGELPFVSIVIPFYNAQPSLEKCIRSLLNLNYPREKYETILVNDCSTDGSVGIANRFAELYPNNIKLINIEKKSGPAKARNKGILQAKGEIIAFTDADCFVHQDWLRAMISRFDEVRVGGVKGNTMPSDPSRSFLFNADIPFSIKGFQTCNIAFRRDVLISVGLFDENFSVPFREDDDLAFSVLGKEFMIIFEPKAIVFHPIKKGMRKIVRWGLQHRFDALLYKKHPKRAAKLLNVKLGFITSWGLAFCASTFSLLLLAISLYLMNTPLQILSISIIIFGYTTTFLKHYRQKGIFGLIGPIVLYVFLFFCEIGRLYGSLRFKKLIF